MQFSFIILAFVILTKFPIQQNALFPPEWYFVGDNIIITHSHMSEMKNSANVIVCQFFPFSHSLHSTTTTISTIAVIIARKLMYFGISVFKHHNHSFICTDNKSSKCLFTTKQNTLVLIHFQDNNSNNKLILWTNKMTVNVGIYRVELDGGRAISCQWSWLLGLKNLWMKIL
jgi:hypothetical protein